VLLKMTVNPRRAIDPNINGSLEFPKNVMVGNWEDTIFHLDSLTMSFADNVLVLPKQAVSSAS
jgi:hypothetical protein